MIELTQIRAQIISIKWEIYFHDNQMFISKDSRDEVYYILDLINKNVEREKIKAH